MKKPSNQNWHELRQKILGLGEASFRKSHYPSLQQRLVELERFKSLINLCSDLLFIIAIDSHKIVEINESVCRVLGLSKEQILDSPFSHFFSNETTALIHGLFQQFKDGSQKQTVFKADLFPANAPPFPAEIIIRYASIDATRYAAFSIRDITERKKTEQSLLESEEQLRQSQKMESIGLLAGGIAHDFNNLLMIIMGYSDMIMEQITPDHPFYDDICQIQNSVDRATALIQQLLAFSRRQVLQPEIVNLNDLVLRIETMLRRFIGEDIAFITLPATGLPYIEADPGQLEQIIMNLVVNARDAMPTGGRLTIETQSIHLDDQYKIRNQTVKPGNYVMLSVTDTGIGMTPETQARIFDPFFTTKKKGQGTGLGLSTVYGIVKQSEGHIFVYSEPSHGTTFKVYFPVKQITQTPTAQSRQPYDQASNTETVLLLEDEKMVRDLVAKALKMQGFTVLEAGHGDEALQIGHEWQDPIHLLLTDVILPGMSGPDAAKKLLLLHPETRVLFMSGYTDHTIVHHGVLHENVHFIQKPFSTDTLFHKIMTVLQQDA
jgi:two-component system, cell cycle sensor histidine kinase and response regulator CckA